MSRMPSRIVITMALGLATLSWAAGPPGSRFHAVDQAFAFTQGGPGCDQTSLTNAIASAGPGGAVQFSQDCPSSAPLNLTNSLTLSQDVTIDGNGHTVTISGIDGPLVVNQGVHVTLNDLTFANRGISFDPSVNPIDNNGTMTITNSTFSDNFVPGEHDSGGAIANSGAMTIANSTFSGNYAAMDSTLTGGGGAISNGGTMTISNSTFAGNKTGDYGGAITNGGMLTVSNTTFSDNTSAGLGGAIHNGGTLKVAASTFSGNSAGGIGGGAISGSFSGSGPITVTNSTFNGNVGAQGGALWLSSGDVTVTNSTFVNNSAVGIGGVPAAGGAIVNLGATVTIENNIFSGSTPSACNGHMTDAGGNLADDTSCSGTATSSLGALGQKTANNGGPTQTIALPSGSVAIDHDHSDCPATDQRGAPRPHAGDTPPTCDAGAYELGATVPQQSLVLSGVPADITADATSAAGAIVNFTPPTAPASRFQAAVWGNLTISCDNLSDTVFPIGVTTVTCTATDDYTNPKTVSATFTITVVDRTLSLAGMPKSIIDTAHYLTGQVETYALPTAVNLEGQTVAAATVSCDPVSGSLFPFGATTVTCTATDGAYANSPFSNTFFVSVSAPGPVITDINPKSGTAGEAETSTLTLSGTGFTEYTKVYLRPADTGTAAQLPTTVASTTQLTADLPANLKAEAAFITIENTRFGGEVSDPVLWPITSSGVALAGTPSFATGVNPSATTGGTGPSTAGSVTVSGISSMTVGGIPGPGILGVYSYASNPAGPLAASSGAYFDAFALPRPQNADLGIGEPFCFTLPCIPSIENPHAFTTVTIVDCALDGGQQVEWWNGTAWAPASDQTYDATSGCVTVTVGGTLRRPTQPSLDQLAGTPFGVTIAAPSVTVPSAQSVQYGTDLSFTVNATNAVAGRQLTLKAAGLPTGLSFKDNGDGTGTVSGTVTAPASASPYTASFTANDGFNDSPAGTVDISVTPAPLTLTAGDKSMTYGGTAPTFTASSNDFVNGDTVASLTGLSCSSATNGHVGTHDITCSGSTNPNYTVTYKPGTLTINPAPLTITADDQTMSYGGTVPALTYSYNGLLAGDTGSTSGLAETCSTTAGPSSHVNTYPITCMGATDLDYTITNKNGTLTISKVLITITASSPSGQTYGSATAPTVTCTATGFLGTDSFTTPPDGAVYDATGTTRVTITSTSDAGAYLTKCTGGDPGGNYTIGTFTPGSFTINPALLTITANNQSYTYGGSFSLSPSIAKSDPSASLSGTLSCHAYALLDVSDATPLAVGGVLLNAGRYTVQCGGLSSPNYSIAWTPGTLTVNQKVVHVTASAGPVIYGAAAPAGFTTTYTSGDFAGADTSSVVSGSLSCSTGSPPGDAVGANVGNYPITCTSSLSATNYTFVSGYDSAGSTIDTALPSSTPALRLGTLTINPAPLTITANEQSYTYGGAFTLSPAVTRSDSRQSTLSGTLSCSAYATTDTTHATPLTVGGTSRTAGSYAIQCTGLSNSNYSITWAPGILTVKQKVITVTASSPSSQAYGSTAAPRVLCTATGFLGTDTFTTTPDGAVYDAAGTTKVMITSTSDAGTYRTKCTGGDPGGNYTIGGYNPGSFTINPVTTTVRYTGTQLWRLGESGQAWTLSTVVTPIACAGSTDGSAVYTLDRNPLTQAMGPYQLSSSSPPAGGAAGWHEGVYTLTATYTPSNHNCSTSSDSATLTIGGPGEVAVGAGSTTVGSFGPVTFGFIVHSAPIPGSSGAADTFSMTNAGKWSLKGTLTSYAKTATNQGAASGTGDLSAWNSTTRAWILVRSGVRFAISFAGKSSSPKAALGLYGQHISWTDPATPNFTPVAIKSGSIIIK